MYLLTWNTVTRRIEASFGGAVSLAEAQTFKDEMRSMLIDRADTHFDVMVDYSTTARMDDEVASIFEETREICLFAGSKRITFVTRNQNEAAVLTNNRLQNVLEGRERYTAHAA
jgi:hypothetical protein